MFIEWQELVFGAWGANWCIAENFYANMFMKMQAKLKASCINKVIWRFEVHTVVITIMAFWDVTLCTLADG
jgi:hypothetical protein